MRYYELFYIIPSKYTEAEVADIMKKVEGFITKYGGKMKRHEDSGKIKFAYPVNKIRFGNYVLAEMEAESTLPKLLDHDLRMTLSAEVLRFNLEELPAELRGRPLKLSAYIAPLSEVELDTPKAPVMMQAPIAKEQAVPAPTAVELDKKIDEALSADVAKL
jgi:ribosomal protein S6